MNMHALGSVSILLAAAGLSSAQTLVSPVTITVNTQFTNPAGAVRTRLLAPGGPGMTSTSASGSAGAGVATAGPTAAASALAGAAVLTVEAAGSPTWRVSSTAVLAAYGEQFFSAAPVSVPVAPGGGPYAANFNSNVSIVDITYSAPVQGGAIVVRNLDGSVTYAQLSALPGGTRTEVVVPTGLPLVLQIAVETGAGGVTGSLRRVVRTLNTWSGAGGVPGNVILPVNLNISEAATLGALSGTIDVVGETELPASSHPIYVGYSKVTATYFSSAFPVHGGWSRTVVLPGDPSAGAWTLGSLTSTASIAANDPGSSYGVQAETFFKHTLPGGNKGVQFLRSRLMAAAELPAVPGGGSASLGSALTMQPGYVRGAFTLCGPPSQPGRPPMLASLKTSADEDTNADGVPDDSPPTNLNPAAWLLKSGLGAATVSGSGGGYAGEGRMIMERTYSAPNVTCEYELALAGPNSETVPWEHPYAYMVMNTGVPTEDGYFDTRYTMTKNGAASFPVAPGSITTRNAEANMGEVILTLRSAAPAVTIWQPQLIGASSLTGDPGNAWTASGIVAYGWPTTVAEAGTRATLRTLLPAGTYTFRPAVNTVSGGNAGTLTLAPFTLTVPPCGRVTADNGVSVSAGVPACVPVAGMVVNGTTNTDGVAVDTITWSLDDGAFAAAAHGGGVNPAYSFTLPPGLAGGTHTVTVKVKTSDGRTATITYQFERDITPPVVVPPANMLITEVPIGGQVVHYFAPEVTDNCGAVSFICSPPSGSVFPLGTTTVTCTATDAAGNSAAAVFTITLQQACPPPIRSHQYAGNADSHFTHPDNAGYHTGTAMTIEAWVNRSDAGRCETIISQNYLSSFWFGFCPGLRFYRSGGFAADATVAVPANQWTHVAVSYDGATARFYVNGTPAGVSALTNSGTGSAGPVTIGADFTFGGSDLEFKGHLDEVRVWSVGQPDPAISYNLHEEVRSGLPATWLVSAFGSGGRTDEINHTTGISGPSAPTAEVEGVLPRYLVVPRTVNNVNINGVINAGGAFAEYTGAEKMPLRYNAGPVVRDGLAQFVYRNEPTDKALYIGLTRVRDVVAPWTRAQSFVAVYFESAPLSTTDLPTATAKDIRFCRRLDGTTGPGSTPVGWQRGDGVGNYANLLPGDPLNSVPSPFGIIGAGGDTMEFRFDLSALGGSDWLRDRRLSISHHWVSGLSADYALPVAQAFDRPYTWSDLIFAGPLPDLLHRRNSNVIYLSWLDPGCDFVLERSPNLQPGSWMPVAAPRDYLDRDGILRLAIVNDLADPRMFFRLRR